MPYHDLMCDVKQKEAGKFINDIVIQHHDMVVSIINFYSLKKCDITFLKSVFSIGDNKRSWFSY